MSPPAPARTTAAGRTYNDLRNLARRHNRDVAEYITLYTLEGFVARLAASEHAADFVLNGGVLMASFAARRPTRDIDLAASGFRGDIAEVEQRVRGIVSQPSNDGLAFDPDSVVGTAIRDESAYSGVRVKVVARLATAKIPIHVDVNFGDPIWPAPIEASIPLLLGGTVRLSGYPEHMVLAEKIVTAIERGEQNTRWRDFTDILAIARVCTISGSDLQTALSTVARYRSVTIEPLEPLLREMPPRVQGRWDAWRKKQRLEAVTPSIFAELLQQCLALTEPALIGSVTEMEWDPAAQSWQTVEVDETGQGA